MEAETDGAAAAPKVPKAWLTLKTYDPESGVVLKFKTDRAAEVGRLINGLGRLGRHMAALPQKTEGMLPFDYIHMIYTDQSAYRYRHGRCTGHRRCCSGGGSSSSQCEHCASRQQTSANY